MEKNYTTEKTFDGIDFTLGGFPAGEYEECIFSNCNLSECILSDSVFIECHFSDCDLSLAMLDNTALRDSVFTDCKMLGLRFEYCNEFGLSFRFEKCILNDCSFFKTKIKKTVFKECRMHEADLSESDLTSSIFDKCDLKGAVFNNTNLEKADLRSSFNYIIDPEINRIKKAKFSIPSVTGLLNKYDISITYS